ncbi:MFS transporter [Salmonella enterica subsp. enterica]|nr:MFS transporter [Salmonella enterica subsp. enterica]
MTNEQQNRLKELRTIRHYLQGMRQGVSGPDAYKGWLTGIGIAAAGFLVARLLPSPAPGVGLVVPAACVAGVIAGGWINRKGRSWRAAIYDALARYNPLNEAAYRALQEKVKEDGFDSDAVMEWTYIEQAEFVPLVPTREDLARDKFLTATRAERDEDDARARFVVLHPKKRGPDA